MAVVAWAVSAAVMVAMALAAACNAPSKDSSDREMPFQRYGQRYGCQDHS